MEKDPAKLGHLPQVENETTEFVIPVLVTGECCITSDKRRLDEAIKDGTERIQAMNRYASHELYGLQVHVLAKTIRDGSWYDVHALVSGVRYSRSRCLTLDEAVRRAEALIRDELQEPPVPMADIEIRPLAPALMLKPDDRASWPYWAYGWHGTDGIDWRSYRTDKGIAGISDIAEESWPIPPYKD